MSKPLVGGRPLRFKTREELIKIVNEYFKKTDPSEYSLTGLALSTGTSKQLLNDYEKRAEFKDIIQEAKLIIENSYEIALRKTGGAGNIFALKNFGWADRSETDITTKGQAMSGLVLIKDKDANKDSPPQ